MTGTITSQGADLDTQALVSLLETMMRIRAFERKVEDLFLAGRIPGFTHLYIGEEAVATGVCAALRPEDYITSTHRGHGHAIAKGARIDRMMAELFGKSTGYCRGKGGSMHIADFSVGMLGANGVVAGGPGIAVGAGLSARMRRSGQVVACFFGDGASNRGTVHEAMNMASVFKLPVVFVNENNGYGSTTPISYSTSVSSIAARAAAYAMPGVTVNGNDVLAVRAAASTAVERARAGEGPSLLECRTYRWRGHFIGDPELYRSKDEVAAWRQRCPVQFFQRLLLESGVASEDIFASLARRLDEEVSAAVRFAENSPLPDPEEALEDLFATALEVVR